MIDKFIYELKKLYEDISTITNKDIQKFKVAWNIEYKIGEKYQELCKSDLKKDMGSFYTPNEVVNFMVEDGLKNIDFKQDPYVKILDPSCGGGYFLSKLFEELLKKAISADMKNPEEHIINNNIFGCDTDEIAVIIATLELFELSGIVSRNIQLADFLFDYSGEFDIILGNPPYMGHKILVGEYRERLYKQFDQVFYDKADFSYCFIQKSIDMLKKNGMLMFFTSRYIIEAMNGKGIRHYLLQEGHLKSIFDFYGIRVIKGVKIDNIILTFQKIKSNEATYVYRLDSTAEKVGSSVFKDFDYKENKYIKVMEMNPAELDENGFVFVNSDERKILDKIKGKALGEYCESYQGIITGCDKAFVIDIETAKEQGIEQQLLLPWIKGKNISQFYVSESKELLIYTNLGTNQENINSSTAVWATTTISASNSAMTSSNLNSVFDSITKENSANALRYIDKHRSRLENRRECKSGRLKWYELQWGRNRSLFLNKKIIFPYKASSNRFAIDSGNCFSADVYAIRLKEDAKGINQIYTYEFLVALLNSSLYEFYVKAIAKKLGRDLYEYYPNKIMTLKIPEFIEALDLEARNNKIPSQENIDSIINKHLDITDEEYQIIRKWCK